MTTTATTPATTPATPARVGLRFDMSTCSRCGGTGRYSYGTCFLCGGAKGKLSRAGRAARAKYDAWKDATLLLPLDDTLVGQVAFIPRQFIGPQNGGQWVTFKNARPVVAIERTADGKHAHVLFSVNLSCPSPWLTYDAEAKTLRVSIHLDADGRASNMADNKLYRAPTGDELRAVFPTLGAGATLVELAK